MAWYSAITLVQVCDSAACKSHPTFHIRHAIFDGFGGEKNVLKKTSLDPFHPKCSSLDIAMTHVFQNKATSTFIKPWIRVYAI